jgi:hypothetical protein
VAPHGIVQVLPGGVAELQQAALFKRFRARDGSTFIDMMLRCPL